MRCHLPAAALVILSVPAVGAEPGKVDAYGDPLPPRALVRLGTGRLRQPSPVTAVAYSADGQRLASACSEGGIVLWELPSGRAVPAAVMSMGKNRPNVLAATSAAL